MAVADCGQLRPREATIDEQANLLMIALIQLLTQRLPHGVRARLGNCGEDEPMAVRDNHARALTKGRVRGTGRDRIIEAGSRSGTA